MCQDEIEYSCLEAVYDYEVRHTDYLSRNSGFGRLPWTEAVRRLCGSRLEGLDFFFPPEEGGWRDSGS